MEFNTTKVEEEKEMINLNVVSSDVSQNCQCNELEERSKKAELRCAELEIELQKKKDHCEALEAKVKVLEIEKFVAEDKLKVVKTSIEGLRRQEEVSNEKKREIKPIVDLEENNEEEVSNEKKREIKPIVDLEENNEAVQLLTQIKDLECQKERAESEVEVWKDKFKKLESWALQLGMGRGNYYHEENGKKQENQQKGTEGNLHLDADFDFQQNQEKVADSGNVVSSCISPSKEIGYMQLAGTPSNGIFQRSPILDSTVQPDSKIVKQLAFETEECPSKKMGPSIPISAKSASVSVIDIIDSDDEANITQNLVPDRQGSGNMSVSTCSATEKQKNSESSCAQINEEDLDFGEDLNVASTKRKRTCNVVRSESESDDDDDNIPICKLKRMHFQDVSANRVRPNFNSSLTATISEDDKVTDTKKIRRRLQPLRNCATKSVDEKTSSCRPHKAKHQKSSPTNDDDDADDDQSEEDLSYSEGEDMSDFIVDDSGESDSEETFNKSPDGSNGDVDSSSSNSQDVQDSNKDSDSQDVSDGDMDFGKILSKIKRSKSNKMKWEFEADMLAAFGKDLELCMKAVCALYYQQISKEQMIKEFSCSNHRGFSLYDDPRGSTLGAFLTDGDPEGGLKKSVEELQEYNPEAVEICRSLACKYSKQLYQIYNNKEDPHFP